MRTLLRCVLLTAVACAVPLAVSAGDLKFTMQSGRVTILAQDIPVRQILQEWARVGDVRIVNAEKLAGPPVTLELVNIPEAQALDTLLSSAAGYMAAPRPGAVIGASLYDRIVILPTSRAPGAIASSATAPTFVQPPEPQPVIADDDDEPVNVQIPGMPPLTLPRMPNANGQPGVAMPATQPNVPAPNLPAVMTAPRPGELTAPQRPLTPADPYQR